MKNFIQLFSAVALLLLFSCNNEEPKISELDDIHNFSNLESHLNNGDVALITSNSDKNVYWVFDGWEYAWASEDDESSNARIQGDKIVCKGSGVSFAKCVKKYVDNGGCATVYKSGDTYYAKKTDCPKFRICIAVNCGSSPAPSPSPGDLVPPGFIPLTIKQNPTLINLNE